MTLDEKIELVKADLLQRFPDCPYTIKILLWQDGTSLVECRHGTMDKLYISTYYKDELFYEEHDVRFLGNMMQDKDGRDYLCIETKF